MSCYVLFLIFLLPVASLQQKADNELPDDHVHSFWPILRQANQWNSNISQNFQNLISTATGIDFDKLTSKCYDRYGCYSIIGPWKNDLTRPVSAYPDSPESIKPQYCLYTRRSPRICDPLLLDDPSSIYRSSYVPKGQVYFIAHGFLESGRRPWIANMTAELLKRSSCNVITIDWQLGANLPYTQAVANIRVVGVMTAHLINRMVQEVVGVKSEKIHIIGHSLGAHLASYVGTALRRTFGMRLGRISGLDPAEPHFAETDTIVRLDPSDAIFVDVIHTDAGGFTRFSLGMRAPVGHIDFYPSGGYNQPKCSSSQKNPAKKNMSLTDSMRNYLNCDHITSYQYFINSINQNLPTLAVRCNSYEEYLKGSCFSCKPDHTNVPGCAPMGFHAIKAFAPAPKGKPGSGDIMLTESPKSRFHVMYSIMGETEPYYLQQYRITIEAANETRETGSLHVDITGQLGNTGFIRLDRMRYFDGGSIQSMIIGAKSVGELKSATVRWSQGSMRFFYSSLNISLITVESIGHTEKLHFCAPTQLFHGRDTQMLNC